MSDLMMIPAARTALPANAVSDLHQYEAKPSLQLGNISSYPWKTVQKTKTEALVKRIDPVDGKYRLSTVTTKVHRCMLDWYDGVELNRVREPSWKPDNLFIYYLVNHSGDLFRLNGTSPPIHEVNATTPIKLTQGNVLDYLRFFCFFVRGEEGPFYIVENLHDPLVPSHPDVHSVLAGTIRPATFEGMSKEGHFLCDAVIYYSNAIFMANFSNQLEW